MRNALAIVAAALLFAPLGASAGIFKCTDANGTTTYSDKPCAGNAQVVTVKPASGGYNPREARRRQEDMGHVNDRLDAIEEAKRNDEERRERWAAAHPEQPREDPCARMKREHAEAKRLSREYIYLPNVRREQEKAKKIASDSFFAGCGSKGVSVFDE